MEGWGGREGDGWEGGGTDRRWMGIVEWGQSGVRRWDIRKWNDWEERSGVE